MTLVAIGFFCDGDNTLSCFIIHKYFNFRFAAYKLIYYHLHGRAKPYQPRRDRTVLPNCVGKFCFHSFCVPTLFPFRLQKVIVWIRDPEFFMNPIRIRSY
jgi:hypothetical protein